MAPARTVAAAALLSGGLALALWLWIERGEHAAPPVPIERNAVTHTPLAAGSSLVAVDSERDAITAPNEADAALPTVSNLARGGAAAPFELRGRLIVIEADGREILESDGELVLGLTMGEDTTHHTIAVEGGVWNLSAVFDSRATSVNVQRASAGGEPLIVEALSGRLSAPFGDELVVRAFKPRGAVLRVVDPITGEDLTNVTLSDGAEQPTFFIRYASSKPDTEIVASGVSSPIALAPTRERLQHFGQAELLVGSPGYVWKRVHVDIERGGEKRVELARGGGELEVLVRGVDPESETRLRLRSPLDAPPGADVELRADGTWHFDGLEAGDYAVRAEIGAFSDSPHELAAATVAIRDAQKTSLELVLAPAPRPQFADVAGTLYVAKEWQVAVSSLNLEFLDTPLPGSFDGLNFAPKRMESDRAGFDAYRWSRSKCQVGRYRLNSFDPMFSFAFELPPEGREDLGFEVAAGVELLVRIVEDATGENFTQAQLRVRSANPDGEFGPVSLHPRFDAERGGYPLRVPPGPIALEMWSWEHFPVLERIDLGQTREHVIRLKPACGLIFELTNGESRIAVPHDWHGEVRSLEGGGRELGMTHDDFGVKYMLSAPGVYEFDTPRIAGHKPAGTQRVEVRAAEFARHVVKLERETR
jgi:hypothetical protein